MDFKNNSIKEFVNVLASSSPVPGGGGAAALTAALSSALSSMVFNLTIGKKSYEVLDAEKKQIVVDSLSICEAKTVEFLEFINKDGEAFSTLMEAYKLPKDIEEEKQLREQRIQEGLHSSMMVPYLLAVEMVQFMQYIETAAVYGNANVISDAGVSIILAYAAVESCILNVMVNVKYIKNESTNEIIKRCKELQQKAEGSKKLILDKVYNKI